MDSLPEGATLGQKMLISNTAVLFVSLARFRVLDIDLEVALEDGRHYEARVRELAPQMYAGRVEPGANIGVRADAADPQYLTLDWLRELED